MRTKLRSATRPRRVTTLLSVVAVILGLLWVMWEFTPHEGSKITEERRDDGLPPQKASGPQTVGDRVMIEQPRRRESAREAGGLLGTKPQSSGSIRLAIRFEDVHGDALEGLLYPNVRQERGWRAAEPIRVPVASNSRPVHVELKVAYLDADLCGYSTGYVPRRVVLREQPGYPKKLLQITFRFERGVEVKGRVIDGSGEVVAGAEVLIRSFQEVPGGWRSMGDKSSRISGGIWEDATTGSDGRFSFLGVSATVQNFQVRVIGNVRQVSPNPRRFYRATSNPFELNLVVE